MLTVRKDEVSGNETESGESKGLRGKEFYEESNFNPNIARKRRKDRETRGNA